MRTDKTGFTRLRVGDLVRWDVDDMLYTIRRFKRDEGRNGTSGIVFDKATRSDGRMPNGMLPDEMDVTKVVS